MPFKCLLAALVLQLATTLNLFAASPLEARFQALEFRADDSPESRVYHYRLFVPENVDRTKRQPLVIWLHGTGESGDDNLKNIWVLPLMFLAANDAPPTYILATQHRKDETWFSSDNDRSGDPLAVTYQILEKTLAENPIDPDRIYILGVSSGGTACFELATRHPDRFAAVAPLASSGGSIARASALAPIPFWAFHQRTDPVAAPDQIRAMVDTLKSLGGSALLTETEWKDGDPTGHDCWTAAFKNYHVLDWLLDQRRGQPVRWPYRFSVWAKIQVWLSDFVWILIGWCVFAVVAWRIWIYVRNRRRRLELESHQESHTGIDSKTPPPS